MLRKIIDNRFTQPLRPPLDRFCARHRLLCRLYERLSNNPNPRLRDALFNQSLHSLKLSGARCALAAWQVDDGAARFRMPMRAAQLGFDWEFALGALGHDVEVKSIYRKAVHWSRTRRKPYQFIDCGANFGIHSAYHLSAGVPTHSFEPNPECLEYFRMLAQLNGWSLDHWHVTALGAEPGQAELVFPPGATWLGSVDHSVQFRPGQSLQRLTVAVEALDQIPLPALPILMKIDVEGSEINVLRGAAGLLRTQVEAVVFESWRDSPDRAELYALFDSLDFDVARINAEGTARILDPAQFLTLPLPNALAIRRSTDPESLAMHLR
ncbi:MAG: FkbM family methyltransferase [Xanthomonadales bacterium]|jgi:FkbM family methyltransferase|nr:FkbM family methyltransferase [Xanthomonadales bacterium]